MSWSLRNLVPSDLTRLRGISSALMTHYSAALIAVGAGNVLFSLIDIWTSSMALNFGFHEANFILLALSNALELSLVTTLAAAKLAFLVGECGMAAVGIATGSRPVKTMIFIAILSSLLTFLLACVNNILWILG